jgi:hypothetical protein
MVIISCQDIKPIIVYMAAQRHMASEHPGAGKARDGAEPGEQEAAAYVVKRASTPHYISLMSKVMSILNK